jgi:hypothetical protein
MHYLLVIKDHADLLSASKLPRGSRIRVLHPDLDPLRSRAVEREMNMYLGECGCRLSAAFLVISMAVTLIWDAIEWTSISHHLISTFIIGLTAIVLCAGVGRALGIFSARIRFKRFVAALIVQLSPK